MKAFCVDMKPKIYQYPYKEKKKNFNPMFLAKELNKENLMNWLKTNCDDITESCIQIYISKATSDEGEDRGFYHVTFECRVDWESFSGIIYELPIDK